jgi:hypothetical protein
MFNIEIERELEVGAKGGEWLAFADVDGDGEKEMVFRQSGGMFHSDVYKQSGHGYITDANQDLLQLTCMRQDGELLWRRGEPWRQEKPYNSHGGKEMTALADVDGDGKLELFYLYKDKLYVLDAKTGERLRDLPVPTDALNIIVFQRLGQGQMNLLLKADGRSPYGYGSPLLAYDADLNRLWMDEGGNGHAICCRDVDGDGADEILEGYRVIDDDGAICWSHDWPSHADDITVEDINEDGIEEVIYCTDNEDFIITDVDGQILLHRTDFPHPQKTSVGHFVAEQPGYQLFMNNRATHGGSVMMDCEGNVLWRFPCNGYSSTLPNPTGQGLDLILFRPGPGRCPLELQEALMAEAVEHGYDDLPIAGNAGFEPLILDGQGQILTRFPFLEASIDVTQWDIPPRLKSDHGAGFRILIEDVDGDGQDEFVFHNRHKVWFLRLHAD